MSAKNKIKALIGYGLIAYATWKLVKNKADPKKIIDDVKSDVKTVSDAVTKTTEKIIELPKDAVKATVTAVKKKVKPLKFIIKM
jgi:hypothetical protein